MIRALLWLFVKGVVERVDQAITDAAESLTEWEPPSKREEGEP